MVVGVLAAAGLAYAALALPWPRRRLATWLGLGLLLAIALQVAANLTAAPLGLEASYWPSSRAAGAPERSTEFPWLTDATRIEPALDLRGEDFGLFFFNDASRFNFGADVQPGRDQLPFSVRWDGWLLVPSSGPRHFVLESTGPAQAWLDGKPLAANDVTLDLSAGLHPIRVDYTRSEARVPWLRLQWQRQLNGDLVPVGGEDLRWRPDAASQQLSAALSAASTLALAVVALAALALGVARLVERKRTLWRPVLWLLPLAFAAYGALLFAPAAGKALVLSGLDDWLIYESSARDILLNGLLMDAGQGHAAPFYGQPLYPYVLALLHRVTGESLFGPIVIQFAALGLVASGTAVLARRCFGTALDGLAALAAFLVLLQLEPEHFKIARQLFNENLYMPLVMASLIVLVTLARRRQPVPWWQALMAGALLGATAISRSQFLLCVPLCLAILWLAWRCRPVQAALTAALIVVGTLAVIAPVTARNWVVSDEFVPISSSGGASLLEFHRPPPGLLDQSALQNDALFNALHLDLSTRTVLAFAEKDPLGYLATLLPLGAHSVGLQGRNDPGVYWPLLITCLLYAVSFLLARTRRLHVWPVHVFVLTHLLILMLFEADTYGYRLVMPMYAPMLAVAAQVPLELVRRAMRSTAAASMRSGEPLRAARFAFVGWSALALGALVWQGLGVAAAWPEREPALHGLGGAAAHAVLTADRVGASALYVASVDGTPRRFGAGVLPGVRYPWLKWFDPQRSLPMPPEASNAVYSLAELRGQPRQGDLSDCLGQADAASEVVVSADQVRQACMPRGTPLQASFDGLARIELLSAPETAAAGDMLETRLLWEPLVARPAPRQISVQLDDPAAADGTLWGNGTLEVYPAQEWQTDEPVLSRVPVATDPTAIPQAYRITVGMSPLKANAAPDLASLATGRTDRVPAGSVVLTPGIAQAGAPLPPDMRPVEGPPLVGGGLELIAARPLPKDVALGSQLRLGLLWKAVQDAPAATQVRVRLIGGGGEVLQEASQPLLGGRAAPSALHAGNVVRDEQSLVVSAGLAAQPAVVELSLEDAWQRLGSLTLSGRAHVMDSSGAPALASFGGAMEVLSVALEPDGPVGSGQKVVVHVRWRAATAMPRAYKVFVHVLDATGQQVVAQRDAEPQDGAAPTTSWVAGEVLEDAYSLVVPQGLAAGEYPIEIGVYDPRNGERLTLASGDNRLLLDAPLRVR